MVWGLQQTENLLKQSYKNSPQLLTISEGLNHQPFLQLNNWPFRIYFKIKFALFYLKQRPFNLDIIWGRFTVAEHCSNLRQNNNISTEELERFKIANSFQVPLKASLICNEFYKNNHAHLQMKSSSQNIFAGQQFSWIWATICVMVGEEVHLLQKLFCNINSLLSCAQKTLTISSFHVVWK